MKPKSLTIIIPSHNEEGNIIACINKIPKLKWETEIIVVDDGTDNTAELAQEFAEKRKNLKVLHFNQKLGQGGAFLKALDIAQGDVIVTLDADYTVDPSEIEKIVMPIFNEEADFVNTSRFIYPMEKGAMTFSHKIGNKFFTLLTSLVIRKYLTDVFCGTKAFKRDLLKGKLTEKEWPALDLIFEAKKNKLRFIEIPVHYKARKSGESKVSAFKTGLTHIRDISDKIKRYYR
ncbi:glycosyltransferase family 2 protein [Candidatus Woesearchaeota archaeon]|nr:glycosyltransferase family 2 protein [Candidatus Woesearchaeota archaeon]